ncbi:MAG: aminotransferase class III-fold pyridoxal phosphate-dependent enzyme, partial [Aggregatilineales bacterium]
IQDEAHIVWMLDYLPGTLLAHASPHSDALLYSLGYLPGEMDAALADFSHPAARREHKWDMAKSGWIADYLHYIETDEQRSMVEHCLTLFEDNISPELESLRKSVIHGDANDYNVLVGSAYEQNRQVSGLIDFGDALYTCTVSNLAIACAYAVMHKVKPLKAALQVIRGYHDAYPLTETEVSLLYSMICMRLAVSVTNSAYRKSQEPDDPYIVISETPAWDALEKFLAIHPRLAHYHFRAACRLSPVPHSSTITDYLKSQQNNIHPVVDYDLDNNPVCVLDLSVGSLMLGADPAHLGGDGLTQEINKAMQTAGVNVAIGRYDEPRLIYCSDDFSTGTHPVEESRTVHLGVDIFAEADTAIYAPLAGTVHCLANNTKHLDYGPLIILRHNTGEHDFYTLYGHLSESSLSALTVGENVAAGEKIAEMGSPPTNGDWTPHLHLQLITDLLELDNDFPGVALASERDTWRSLSPAAYILTGLPDEKTPVQEKTYGETLTQRQNRLGGNLSLSYNQPLKIVRGWMQYLYDDTGHAYLDMYNNVAHIGHSHPDVVQVVQQQVALLNTNTRYLHDNILDYAARLTALMPEPLSVCYFVNSASEANELALRLAYTYTQSEETIVLEAAYHGHTTGLIDISPYKFNGKGGRGAKSHVHVAPVPDDYRGAYKRDDPERHLKYAAHISDIIEKLHSNDKKLGAFIAETLPSVGGQIIPPPGYLKAVYEQVRAAGGICIADEVQVAFGRLGDYFWGFEMQEALPDIVVLGKPIGNGFPLGAVITTPEIAAAFDNGMEFFSTFGGNPVACSAGLALLNVLKRDNLPANAATVGAYLIDKLTALMEKYPIIGDVRGVGLFLGIELVNDRITLDAAAFQASYIVNRLRENGILAGTDGPLHNVIKLRPMMIFTQNDADFFLMMFDKILQEDAAQPRHS